MRKENIGKKKEVIDTLYKFRKILVIRLDKQNTKPMPADAYLMLMNQKLIKCVCIYFFSLGYNL